MMSKLCAGVASVVLVLAGGVVRGEDSNVGNTYEWVGPLPQSEGVWNQEHNDYWDYYDDVNF